MWAVVVVLIYMCSHIKICLCKKVPYHRHPFSCQTDLLGFCTFNTRDCECFCRHHRQLNTCHISWGQEVNKHHALYMPLKVWNAFEEKVRSTYERYNEASFLNSILIDKWAFLGLSKMWLNLDEIHVYIVTIFI